MKIDPEDTELIHQRKSPIYSVNTIRFHLQGQRGILLGSNMLGKSVDCLIMKCLNCGLTSMSNIGVKLELSWLNPF